MKKISLIISAILILTLSFAFSGCSHETLATPVNLYANEEENLIWSPVDNARSYEVKITDIASGTSSTRSARRPSYGLATLAEGDYDICVRACGLRNVYSEWSLTLSFKKEKDVGYTFLALNDGTAWALTSARASKGDVTIPDNYRGKHIVEIADGAFRNNQQVTSVKFGKYVRTLGSRVFYNCIGLKSVEIPKGLVHFGDSNFQNCALLESVELPETLDSIPDFTFAYCGSLTSYTFSENVKSIGESAFYYCSLIKEIVLPDGVETIGEYAFAHDDALVSVELGEGVKSIGPTAFYGNEALTSVTFRGTSYEGLQLGDGVFSNCPELVDIELPEGTESIPVSCFEGDTNLTDIRIPESVGSVGSKAFLDTPAYANAATEAVYVDGWLVSYPQEQKATLSGLSPDDFQTDTVGIAEKVFFSCAELMQVTIPSSLKYVGRAAFAECEKLWKFMTEEHSKIETIGELAFYFCRRLSQVGFHCAPDAGLKSIENYAFYGCTPLDNNATDPTLLVPETVTHIGDRAFEGTGITANADIYGLYYAGDWVVGFDPDREVQSVTLRDGVTNGTRAVRGIADYAFYKDQVLTTIDGIARVRYIGEYAFMFCSELQQITLNANMTEIAPGAFFQCSHMTIAGGFPEGLTSIGEMAFFQCDSLTRIDLSGTEVKEIGQLAFFSCGSPVQNGPSASPLEIKLPEGLTTIGDLAFCLCSEVSVEIPGSVRNFGFEAFGESPFLSSLTLHEGLEEIPAYAFRNAGIVSLELPDSLKRIGVGAFYQCPGLEEISFGSGLEEIDDYAFAFALSLKSLELPETIRSIGDGAFLYCMGLPAVILPENLGYLGNNVFYGCTDATFYTALDAIPEAWSARWNASYRPVVWGAELSEGGDYIVSVPALMLKSVKVRGGLKVPARAGFEFLGWSTQQNATQPEYEVGSDLSLLPDETILYAIYGSSVQ